MGMDNIVFGCEVLGLRRGGRYSGLVSAVGGCDE
jgi:hypothetical protein